MSDANEVRALVVEAYAHDMLCDLLRHAAITPAERMAAGVAELDEGMRNSLGDTFEECFLQFRFPQWSVAYCFESGGRQMRADAFEALDVLLRTRAVGVAR